jgi:hypothetical protein
LGIWINLNTYALSGGLPGGQYTIVFVATVVDIPSGNGIQLNVNGIGIGVGTGQGLNIRFNFNQITSCNPVKYIVLTFAYDGVSYYLCGSNFDS